MEGRSQPKQPNPNTESNSTNPNEKKKKKSEFQFCKVCNRNHDEGQRHKYFPSHTKSLSKFLSRFQSKITEIRFFLKNPSILSLHHASPNRFWCAVCDFDMDELGSSFACYNAINHLASVDHLKNLKHFLWKHCSGMDRLDAFRILEGDVAKWEKKCKTLKSEAASSGEVSRGLPPSNDIHNELNFENMTNFENNTFQPLNSNISNGVIPLQYYTDEYQVSHSGLSGNTGLNLHVVTSSLPTDTHSGTSLWNTNNLTVNRNSLPNGTSYSNDVQLSKVGMYQVYQDERVLNRGISSSGLPNLTQVSSNAPQEAGGNVHSGAPPPWFEVTEGNQLISFVSSSNKSRKSKLNPKRVGAAWAEKRKMEIEMEKSGEIVKTNCDPNWLPNFGRVWQSGSRKESRKEFEIEKQNQPTVESHLEMTMKIQPYISKRMRRDAGEDPGDPHLNK